MIFLLFFFFMAAFLFWNIRKISPNVYGSLIAGILLIATLGSFLLREQAWACAGQAFFMVWACQAILLYLLWNVFLLLKKGFAVLRHSQPQSNGKAVLLGSRIILGASLCIAAAMLVFGSQNNLHYKIQELHLHNQKKTFTALFFSDIHLDPLFKKEKLEKFIAQADSIQPDFIFFGGDLADISDSAMDAAGYDSLFRKLTSAAKTGAFAVVGNHEAFMERSGSRPVQWMQKVGMTVLNDETVCTPLACITGRTDFQMARAKDVPRKNLAEMLPTDTSLPWILLDHQPRGIEENYSGALPDLALSGHTHHGQFFPATTIIHWIWEHAYGIKKLDGVLWLVSSGLDSWGPPVRIGSDTEFWVINTHSSTSADPM